MTVNLQPVHPNAMVALNSDSLRQQGASSTTVWGLPLTSELPNGRWKRKPTKVWVKGKRGFKIMRRKSGLKKKKMQVKLQKDDLNHSVKIQKLKSDIKVPVRLSIPTSMENAGKFVDFGNSWKHEEDYKTESVKVKRKKQSSDVLLRKGKHFKTKKSKDRNPARMGAIKNYRLKNNDGSITWGYVNNDGSYKV